MTVYVLFHETNSGKFDDSDGYVEAIYATQDLADAAKLHAVRKAIADGEDVYYNPDTEESFDHWDHAWRVEAWPVLDALATEEDR